jgi:hypothetical protein
MKIRVIAADDFPLVREGIVRALNRDPAIEVVGEANNGDDALELVAALRPDVLILDLIMPGLDGLGVLERISPTAAGSPRADPDTLRHELLRRACAHRSARPGRRRGVRRAALGFRPHDHKSAESNGWR